MENTKIDWCDSTWNPVTGCLHKCEYCYARAMANRYRCQGYPLKADGNFALAFKNYETQVYGDGYNLFELDTALYQNTSFIQIAKSPYPFGFKPTLHRYRLADYLIKKPQVIFVCSMADLFGAWVPDSWIKEVFEACEAAPQHTYLFLTKNPKRYLDLYNNKAFPYKSNFWFGATVTTSNDDFVWLQDTPYHSFVSVEPMLESFEGCLFPKYFIPEWIIIGAESGNRKDKVIPKKEWIDDIVDRADEAGVPVFMKSSLIPIVGEENMLREFPGQISLSKGPEVHI